MLRQDQVAESWRTRRVKDRFGSLPSVSAAFEPAGPIYLGNPGLFQSAIKSRIPHLLPAHAAGCVQPTEGDSTRLLYCRFVTALDFCIVRVDAPGTVPNTREAKRRSRCFQGGPAGQG